MVGFSVRVNRFEKEYGFKTEEEAIEQAKKYEFNSSICCDLDNYECKLTEEKAGIDQRVIEVVRIVPMKMGSMVWDTVFRSVSVRPIGY